MLQLWFSKISSTTKIELSTEKLLSDSEAKRLSSTRSLNKRREFLLSRALMRHALSQNFSCPIDKWLFTEREGQFPRIANLPSDTYLSLSHSKGIICFAISDSPIGIDIEYAKPNRDFSALAQAFMNDKELLHLQQNPSEQIEIFYRTWCAKEAFFKAASNTVQRDILYKEIQFHSLLDNGTCWTLTEGKLEEFYISAITKAKPANISSHCFPEEGNSLLFTVRQ